MVLTAGAALAGARSFTARVDRNSVAENAAFVFEVTLVLEDGRAEGYTAPDFAAAGLRVLGQHPSQSTQIQMGGGASFMQVVYSWRYELAPTKRGAITIGAARVRVEGRELRTNPLTIQVGDGAAPGAAPATPQRAPAPASGAAANDPLFPPSFRAPRPDSQGDNFVRAVPSQPRAYVGEQITVDWYLFLAERQDKYQTLTEPRTDGFWAEDLPVPGNQRGLALTQQTHQGRTYLVAPLLKKALFPLRPGKLTVTPLESEISQVDFFGSTVRTERIKADPLVVEVMPLPTSGQPRGFDAAAVGRYTIAAKIDRDRVGVGEAVTVTVTLTGTGNIRQLPAPRLPPLPGWKAYDPKISTTVTPGTVVSGTKTVEFLLLPERPGATTLPPFELTYFDPAEKRYVTERTAPIPIEVTADATPGATAAGGGPAGAAASPGAGPVENVLPAELRPIRAKGGLNRDLGTTLYRSRAFAAVLIVPPLAFGLTVLIGSLRERLSRETERGRQRRTRRQVRRRLGAAERHLREGQASAFYIEIDRVIRDLLAGKLREPVTGLSRDELRHRLVRAGFAAPLIERIVGELEECDRARFAPGSVAADAMAAALERAGELILIVDKTRTIFPEDGVFSA